MHVPILQKKNKDCMHVACLCFADCSLSFLHAKFQYTTAHAGQVMHMQTSKQKD
jgi:hypothetical protein